MTCKFDGCTESRALIDVVQGIPFGHNEHTLECLNSLAVRSLFDGQKGWNAIRISVPYLCFH